MLSSRNPDADRVRAEAERSIRSEISDSQFGGLASTGRREQLREKLAIRNHLSASQLRPLPIHQRLIQQPTMRAALSRDKMASG